MWPGRNLLKNCVSTRNCCCSEIVGSRTKVRHGGSDLAWSRSPRLPGSCWCWTKRTHDVFVLRQCLAEVTCSHWGAGWGQDKAGLHRAWRLRNSWSGGCRPSLVLDLTKTIHYAMPLCSPASDISGSPSTLIGENPPFAVCLEALWLLRQLSLGDGPGCVKRKMAKKGPGGAGVGDNKEEDKINTFLDWRIV